ncbi:Uncharacterised protein [Mycobacteroides abscessus subsp. abscessus]|nr:Uncharacterised protein [Mycobacteroides abscessus subsp. abscessus]
MGFRSTSAPAAEPAKVVESHGRLGSGEIDVGIQIAHKSVGHALGQGAQLLLGILDHRAQQRIAGHHLIPAQLARRSPGLSRNS